MKKLTEEERNLAYQKLEDLVLGRLFQLENENLKLTQELNVANAKLSVYERMVHISDQKTVIGFEPKGEDDVNIR